MRANHPSCLLRRTALPGLLAVAVLLSGFVGTTAHAVRPYTDRLPNAQIVRLPRATDLTVYGARRFSYSRATVLKSSRGVVDSYRLRPYNWGSLKGR